MSVPLYVISGFLGSGKTTLINRILETAPVHLKIIVLVNEFGAISIDKKLINIDPDKIIDLSGGCICCGLFQELMACLRFALDDFNADIILIESTGLALPQEIVRQALTPAFEKTVALGAIITVVDAEGTRFDDYPIIAEQLKASDIVILNKADRVDSVALGRIRHQIRRTMPPGSAFIETPYDKITYHDICRPAIDRIPYGPRRSSAPDDVDSTAGYAAICLVIHQPVPLPALVQFYHDQGSTIIRSKGFLRTENGAMELQVTPAGIHMKDTGRPIKRTEIVLIVRQEDKQKIENRFRSLFNPD